MSLTCIASSSLIRRKPENPNKLTNKNLILRGPVQRVRVFKHKEGERFLPIRLAVDGQQAFSSGERYFDEGAIGGRSESGVPVTPSDTRMGGLEVTQFPLRNSNAVEIQSDVEGVGGTRCYFGVRSAPCRLVTPAAAIFGVGTLLPGALEQEG